MRCQKRSDGIEAAQRNAAATYRLHKPLEAKDLNVVLRWGLHGVRGRPRGERDVVAILGAGLAFLGDPYHGVRNR